MGWLSDRFCFPRKSRLRPRRDVLHSRRHSARTSGRLISISVSFSVFVFALFIFGGLWDYFLFTLCLSYFLSVSFCLFLCICLSVFFLSVFLCVFVCLSFSLSLSLYLLNHFISFCLFLCLNPLSWFNLKYFYFSSSSLVPSTVQTVQPTDCQIRSTKKFRKDSSTRNRGSVHSRKRRRNWI